MGRTLDEIVTDRAFIQRVENLLIQARHEAFEILGREVVVLLCKWEGCVAEVSTHKGVGGYCATTFVDGKSHRELHIEQRREIDPDFMRSPNRVRPPARPVPPARVVFRDGRPVPKAGGLDWLQDVKSRVNAALAEVESAEHDLEQAKARLREILAEAQNAIR